MSARARRKKAPSVAPGVPVQGGGPALPAMPKWDWRTFPVFFAFSLGGFLGLYMGLIAGATSNQTVTFVAFIIWAMLLGFGFSRLTSRWMLSRGWSRAAKRKKA